MPITVRDMIRRLEDDGWRWERTRGSHRVYSHPTKPGIVVVPGKLGKQLPLGTEHPQASGVEVTDMIGYAVIVEQADDGGYGAWSSDLPGCIALGDTIEDCLAEMQEAISLYIDVLRERGDEVPQARAIQAVTLPAA